MYEKFYKLTGKPFQLNPDPQFFFSSRGHQRAMSYLRYGIQQGQGFIVVTGNVGTGKTMLVNNLFRELDEHNVVAAKVVSTNVGEDDLLRLVASNFGIDYSNATKATLLNDIEQYCRRCIDEGKRVLLVVDECQNLPKSSLEELRMLSNFDYNGQPVVQSFLLGQHEFQQVMRAPGLEQLRQRVIAAYHLKPLSPEEIREYIEHRLRTVGWNGDPRFDEGIYAALFEATGGVPRRINTLMDRVMLYGGLEGLHTITPQVFANVVAELRNEQGDPADYLAPERERIDTGAGSLAAPAAGAPEIQQLEARLEAMQRAMESLSRRLAAAPAMPAAGTPSGPMPVAEMDLAEQAAPVVPVPLASEEPPRTWTWAFGVTLAVVLAVGAVFVYLLNEKL